MIPALIKLPPNRVWRTYPGGKLLDSVEGRDRPADTHFPEDWIGSVTRANNPGRENLSEEGYSAVTVDGKRRLIKDLIAENPAAMLGAAHVKKYGTATRFLLKYLDAAIRLHVQAHPTIPFAKARLGSDSGKTEGYYILETRPEVADPCIYLGFKEVPARETLRSWILEQDLPRILSTMHRIPVKPGDCFIVPGGFLHAIGDGVLMTEIMEPTDFAVRLEFERGGYVLPEASRFMGRDVEFALDMIEWKSLDLEALKRGYFVEPRAMEGSVRKSLIDERYTGCFRVERWSLAPGAEVRSASFFIALVLEGSGSLAPAAGPAGTSDGTPAKKWDRFFITHSAGGVRSEGSLELLCVFPPD
jgi:mannose-6-phosphate isomerase